MRNDQSNPSVEKTLGPVEWISLIASIITILVFIVNKIYAILMSEIVYILAGVAGIFWIATILRKISIAITELRAVKNEIFMVLPLSQEAARRILAG